MKKYIPTHKQHTTLRMPARGHLAAALLMSLASALLAPMPTVHAQQATAHEVRKMTPAEIKTAPRNGFAAKLAAQEAALYELLRTTPPVATYKSSGVRIGPSQAKLLPCEVLTYNLGIKNSKQGEFDTVVLKIEYAPDKSRSTTYYRYRRISAVQVINGFNNEFGAKSDGTYMAGHSSAWNCMDKKDLAIFQMLHKKNPRAFDILSGVVKTSLPWWLGAIEHLRKEQLLRQN